MAQMCGKLTNSYFPIFMILALYTLLGLVFNLTIPPFEAFDEPEHFLYINHLRQTRSLPVQTPNGAPTQSNQPPLYYFLAAIWSGPFLPVDIAPLLHPNPHWGYDLSRPGEPNNLNRYSHGPELRWPYDPATVAVHWVRLISLLCGIGTVILTWQIARLVFSDQRRIMTFATALVAFNPEFVFMTNVINNDALAIFMGAMVLWQLMLLLHKGLSWYRGFALGLLMGIALLSKLTTAFYAPVAIGVILYLGLHERPIRNIWKSGLFFFIGTGMTTLWWFMRNLKVYGDVLGLEPWRTAWKIQPMQPSFPELIKAWPQTWRSMWALFGWGNVIAAPWVYHIIGAFCVFCLIGWLHAARKPKIVTFSTPQRLQIVFIWLIAVLAMSVLLGLPAIGVGSNARYVFVALPAFALLLAGGLHFWTLCMPPFRAQRTAQWAENGSIIVSFAFCAFVMATYLRPVYYPSPEMLLKALPADAYRLDWRLGEHIRLQGYHLSERRVFPGDELELILYWQADTLLVKDYSVFVHLLGPEQQSWGSVDTFPGMGTYPTRAWRPGEIIADRYRVHVMSDQTTPSAAWLEVGMYDFASGNRLPIRDSADRLLSFPVITRIAIGRQNATLPAPKTIVDADFGGQLRLVGYDSEAKGSTAAILTTSPGGHIYLTLYWQALAPPAEDYVRFVHLTDKDGKLVAQTDVPVGTSRYPTALWDKGEWVTDEVRLAFPLESPAGTYDLLVGLYSPITLRRLTLPEAADHLQLLSIIVQ